MSPFGVMRRVADEMNQMFNQGLSATRDLLPIGGGFGCVDVRETDDAYLIEADLPGVKAEDVDVTVKNETLILKGETSYEREDGDGTRGYYLSERRYGSFHREIPLPGPVDEGKATANLKDGVLKVCLPKSGKDQGRRIQVADHESGEGGTVPGTAEHASQPGVEASTADQSYVNVGSGESAEEAAKAFEGSESSQKGEKSRS